MISTFQHYLYPIDRLLAFMVRPDLAGIYRKDVRTTRSTHTAETCHGNTGKRVEARGPLERHGRNTYTCEREGTEQFNWCYTYVYTYMKKGVKKQIAQ